MMMLTVPGLDVAVEGDGYLRLLRGGAVVYARRARLGAAGGYLSAPDGAPVVPKIAVAGAFSISLDGTVTCGGRAAGRLVLALFPEKGPGKGPGGKPEGRATLANPGEGAAGVVRASRAVAKAAVSPAKTRVLIALRASSEASGERILLGDVAEISAPVPLRARLARLDLGRTPPMGTSRLLGRTFVAALVRGAGLKPESFDLDVPAEARVVAAGQTVEAQTLLDAALGAPGAEGLVAARPPAPVALPKGEITLTADPIVRGPSGASVTVRARVGSVTTARTVALVPDPAVPLAKTGDAVRLRLVSGGATIEVAGKIKTGGRVGSEVTVVAATGSVHTGKLLPNGLVEVRL